MHLREMGVVQMQQHISRNEYTLLEHYIRMRLQTGSEAASTMASWTEAHSDLNSAPCKGAVHLPHNNLQPVRSKVRTMQLTRPYRIYSGKLSDLISSDIGMM